MSTRTEQPYDITKTPRKAAKYYQVRTEQVPHERLEKQEDPQHSKGRFMFSLGLGMCLFISGVILWNMVVVPWWHGVAVRWEYGVNQVSVFGADVGHGGTSRFIAFDNDNEIIIVEVIQKSYSVYTIPTGSQQNRLVTLTFRDVNNDGKLDLVVQVEGEEGVFVLFNTGDAFSLTK